MKKILFIFAFILTCAINAKTQSSVNANVLLNKSYLSAVESSSVNVRNASYLLDNNYSNRSTSGSTRFQINTKSIRKLSGIKIYPMLTTNCYVFISKAPFFHTNIEALISDPWVTYFNITGGSGNTSFTGLPINNIYGQYIMILSTNDVPLFIDEVDIYGNSVDFNPSGSIVGPLLSIPYGDGGPWIWPNDPPSFPPYIVGPPFVWTPPYTVGPNGTGVWPWWSSHEICNDGIDNDGNGFTDCDDYPCGVGWFNVVKTDPTCPICNNGKICVYSGNQIKKVSIDNGVSWVNFPPTQFYCFDNLSDGTYNVKLQTQYGCEDGKPVVLQSPIGQLEICENGGFEEGTFNNWEGGTDVVYPTIFSNTIINAPRHQIMNNMFVDPNAPFIVGNGGTYSARLGDGVIGNKSQKLTYCKVIDNVSSDFSFNWAAVMQLPPNHLSGYFEYRVFNKNSGQTIQGPTRTTAQSPFLQDLGMDLKAIGWTCEKIDLSNFIGQEVCIEFITSNCTCTGHYAYAYIDDLCEAGSFAPDLNIISNETYCSNQNIEISVEGTGFQQSNWKISQVDDLGNETGVVVTPIINSPTVPSITDLIELYQSNGGGNIVCPKTLKLQLTVYSGTNCGSFTAEKKVKLVCPNYNIDYCDPLYYCLVQNQIQIQGINDCDNCKYEWSSPEGLSGMINTTFKFPTLDRSLNVFAFDKEYNVTVTTPEGCEYDDTFSMLKPEIIISVDPIVLNNHCTYDINGAVSLNFDAPIGLIKAKATNVLTGEIIVVPLIGTGSSRTFQITVSREIETQYEIVVFIDNEYFCKTGSCFDRLLLNKIKKSPFHTQWKAAWPNLFCNNTSNWGIQCDDLNDRFNLTFNSVDNLDCNKVNNPQNSSIYYYNLKIYGRWGNLVFEGTVSKLPTDDFGITGSEPAVTWDGLFNGEEGVDDVYTWTAIVKSCYSGSNYCNNCGPTQNFQYCGSGNYDEDGYEEFHGDILLLN